MNERRGEKEGGKMRENEGREIREKERIAEGGGEDGAVMVPGYTNIDGRKNVERRYRRIEKRDGRGELEEVVVEGVDCLESERRCRGNLSCAKLLNSVLANCGPSCELLLL